MSDDKRECCSWRIWGRRTVFIVLSTVVLGAVVYVVAASVPGILRRVDLYKQRRRAEQFLEKNPTNAYAAWQLAVLYRQEGRHEDAVECARQAVGLAPDHADAWLTYGLKALVVFRRARNTHRRADALGDMERAAEGLRQVCTDGVRLSSRQDRYAKDAVLQDWSVVAGLFKQAGRLHEAGEAQSMAVSVARQLADSEDPEERELGRRRLKWLRDESPWTWPALSEGLNEASR